MSPGPATYRSKTGFDSSPADARSQSFLNVRKLSLPQARFGFKKSATSELIPDSRTSVPQRSIDVSSRKGSDSVPPDEECGVDKDRLNSKQDAIMGELHTRMLQLTQSEARKVRKGTSLFSEFSLDNEQKVAYLSERDTFYLQQLNQCSQDKGSEASASDAILSGDVLVKVLRVASGRNLGPGVYSAERRAGSISHNIKGSKEFQSFAKCARNGSPEKVRKKEEKGLVSSFYASQRIILIQLFADPNKKPAATPKSRRQASLQFRPCFSRGTSKLEFSPTDKVNQTGTTAGDSKELVNSVKHKSLSSKNTLKARQDPTTSPSLSPQLLRSGVVSSFAAPNMTQVKELKERTTADRLNDTP